MNIVVLSLKMSDNSEVVSDAWDITHMTSTRECLNCSPLCCLIKKFYLKKKYFLRFLRSSNKTLKKNVFISVNEVQQRILQMQWKKKKRKKKKRTVTHVDVKSFIPFKGR